MTPPLLLACVYAQAGRMDGFPIVKDSRPLTPPALIAVASAAGVSTTPPNAIVYSSGLVPLRQTIRAGIWLDLSGAALIWLFLRVLCPLLGMA